MYLPLDLDEVIETIRFYFIPILLQTHHIDLGFQMVLYGLIPLHFMTFIHLE